MGFATGISGYGQKYSNRIITIVICTIYKVKYLHVFLPYLLNPNNLNIHRMDIGLILNPIHVMCVVLSCHILYQPKLL